MIFDFAFNPYALLSIFAVVINLVLIYLISSRGLQSTANRWFVLVLVTLVIWGATEALERFSANPTASDFWSNLGSISWIFVSPVFLTFTILYVGREKFASSFVRQALLFGPAFVFLYLGWSTELINSRNIAEFEKVYYGWNSPVAPLFWLILLWLDALFVTALVFLTRFYFKAKSEAKKRQTLIFIIAVLIPIVGGSITNGVLPILGYDVFPAAVILTSVMSLLITYAILKYRLFTINPATVVTNIVKTMNEIVVVFNLNHQIEFVNDAVGRVLGYSEDDLIGKPFKKLVDTNWDDFHNNTLSQVHGGKTISGADVELISKDGEKIPVSFSASPLKDPVGNIFGIVGVSTDISKIRELFADVTAERNKLTTTMESIIDGVLALDFDGKVTMTNPAALKMLGVARSDILGNEFDKVITLTEGGDRVLVKELLPKEEPKADAIITQKENIQLVTKFGKELYVNLTSSEIKEGREVGLGAILTLNDVSKEKELEEMKLDFVSMAAHELRTPLTAIRGYLSVLQEETMQSLSKEQRSFLDKAFISSSQLAALVENLLSVSKIERGAMRLELEDSNWKEVLQETFNNFIPIVKEKNIKFKLNCPEDLPKVMVDKFRISEVLSNLLANAINYTTPGRSVTVSAEKGDNEIITHVKDTGQGIPESALPKLFSKFFRVSGVLEQGSKGTGLGLYISKAIIDMHKGRIWVKSKLGVGSTFSFTVPMYKEEKKQTQISNKKI